MVLIIAIVYRPRQRDSGERHFPTYYDIPQYPVKLKTEINTQAQCQGHITQARLVYLLKGPFKSVTHSMCNAQVRQKLKGVTDLDKGSQVKDISQHTIFLGTQSNSKLR